jgi:hypothetical protein
MREGQGAYQKSMRSNFDRGLKVAGLENVGFCQDFCEVVVARLVEEDVTWTVTSLKKVKRKIKGKKRTIIKMGRK